jgi:hypothetical protein
LRAATKSLGAAENASYQSIVGPQAEAEWLLGLARGILQQKPAEVRFHGFLMLARLRGDKDRNFREIVFRERNDIDADGGTWS